MPGTPKKGLLVTVALEIEAWYSYTHPQAGVWRSHPTPMFSHRRGSYASPCRWRPLVSRSIASYTRWDLWPRHGVHLNLSGHQF